MNIYCFFQRNSHLNDLPQINCQENEKTGRIISIDCKWYRTLLYLHKRNISIDFNQNYKRDGKQSSSRCSLSSLINNKANNIALVSRCLVTDFDSAVTTGIIAGSTPTRMNGQHVANQSNVRVYTLDSNVKYEFRIEPDLSQVLIEGDSLELTCRLTKKTSNLPHRKHHPTWFNSQIKWFLVFHFRT